MSDEPPSENRPLPKLDEECREHPALGAWLFQTRKTSGSSIAGANRLNNTTTGAPYPPDMREDVTFAIRRWRNRQLGLIVCEKMKAVEDQLNDESLPLKERIEQSEALMGEVNVALLDTPEPHRSRFLKDLLPTWEAIRSQKENPQ